MASIASRVARLALGAIDRPVALALVLAYALSPIAGAAAPSTGDGWYSSDPSGLPGEPLAGATAPPGSGYALKVESGAGRLEKTLYRDGEAFKVWLTEFGPGGLLKREYHEREGEPIEETAYDADGRPATLRVFKEGGSIEETAYSYASGRLVSAVTTRDGTEIGALAYVYAPDGRAVSVKERSGAFIGQGRSGSGPSSTWRKGPDGLEIRSYDADGRLASIKLYVDGVVAKTEERRWVGKALASTTASAGDETVRSEYALDGPGAGKATLVAVTKAGSSVSTVSTAYDDDGRVAKVERRGPAGASTTTYAYGEDGSLLSEREESGGAAVVKLYRGDGTTVEESYGERGLFARVYYADGRRVREELIVEGVVVRARSFE